MYIERERETDVRAYPREVDENCEMPAVWWVSDKGRSTLFRLRKRDWLKLVGRWVGSWCICTYTRQAWICGVCVCVGGFQWRSCGSWLSGKWPKSNYIFLTSFSTISLSLLDFKFIHCTSLIATFRRITLGLKSKITYTRGYFYTDINYFSLKSDQYSKKIVTFNAQNQSN